MAALTNCWAGRFDGANNECVDCGDHAAFNFQPMLNEFSIQVWIKLAAPSAARTVIGKGLTGAQQYSIKLGEGGDPYAVNVYLGGVNYEFNTFAAGILIGDSNWHQLILVVYKSDCLLYVDGTYIATESLVASTTMSASHLIIGAVNDTSAFDFTEYIAGAGDTAWITEVGIWRKVLLAAEVAALYNGGDGLMLNDDSGSYVSSDELEGWWRFGDGATENPDSAPTTTIADESGNLRHATYTADTPDIVNFYDDSQIAFSDFPGTCPQIGSSSSLAAAPQLRVLRSMQGNLAERSGFEGDLHRMVVASEINRDYLDDNVFVYEMARVIVGSPIRRPVFRRVATITDMEQLTTEPATKFPHAYRTNRAELLGETTTILDAAWLEVQRQAAKLSLDLIEYGIPGNDRTEGRGEAELTDQEAYSMPDEVIPVIPSSSSAQAAASSSSSIVAAPSSSSIILVPSSSLSASSSSAHVVPEVEFIDTLYVSEVRTDCVTRMDYNGTKTLYTDLGFIRFGRDSNPLQSWDAFIRISVDIPACALIEACNLTLSPHTTERGEDVVLRIHDIYSSAAYDPVGPFVSTADPTVANRSVVWDRLPTSGLLITPDISELLQFFVDRSNYVVGDYFGLWIQEERSDAGARRDASTPPTYAMSMGVRYRTDRECPTSSSSSSTG